MRTTITRKVYVAAAFAAALLAAAATFPAVSAQAADTNIIIDQFAFTPQRVTVKAGATVAWINDDDIPHTVASSTKVFKSKKRSIRQTNSRSPSRHLASTNISAPCIRT